MEILQILFRIFPKYGHGSLPFGLWYLQVGCNPECYTKGRGCIVSNQGRCALLFDEEPKQMVKSFQEAFDALIKDNKMNSTYKPTKRPRKIAP